MLVTIFSILLSLKTSIAHADENKWQVCGVSEDGDSAYEIQTFKKKLGSARFEFVQLSGELEDICKTATKCDVLLISGHYTGDSFLGLFSTADLMKRSCKGDCKNVLSHPLETYTFACNTSSTKDRDFRSDGDYRTALLAHGIPSTVVEHIVQLRYGLIDPSNREQLNFAFKDVEHLYGFSSTAPSQTQLEKSKDLEKYLDDFSTKGGATYDAWLAKANLERINQQLADVNHLITRDFSQYSIHECHPADITGENNEVGNVFCFFNTEKHSYAEKIDKTNELIRSGKFLKYFSTIFDFLAESLKDKPLPAHLNSIDQIFAQNLDQIKRQFSYVPGAPWNDPGIEKLIKNSSGEVKKQLERITDPKQRDHVGSPPVMAEAYFLAKMFHAESATLKQNLKANYVDWIRKNAALQNPDDICTPSADGNHYMFDLQNTLRSSWTAADVESITRDNKPEEMAILKCLGAVH